MKKTDIKPILTTRRQLLTLMGLGGVYCYRLDPFRMIARSLVDGLIADAEAQSAPAVKNLLTISLPGAPTRWVWDGFLNLNNQSIVANASLNNWLTSDSYAPAQIAGGYKSEAVLLSTGSTVYLPPLWNRNIPKAGGGVVPMKSLLNNTIIMRGVDMQADLGHDIGPAKALFPIAADASLTGLVGDSSDRPLPVVGTTGQFNYADPIMQGFKALKGTSPTLINTSTDSLSVALSPFINTDPAVTSNASKLNSAAIQNAIKNAMAELGNYTKASMPGSDVLYKGADKATQLFQTTFGNLTASFNTLVTKYSNLASTCAHTVIPNILPSSGSGGYNIAGSYSNLLPYQFAVAEYLLVNGYSSSVSICDNHTSNVANLAVYSDEHTELDRPKSLICNSYKFFALSAMLNEFRSAMIANNIWEKTLVHISSEYNRIPDIAGTGSQHAPEAGVITMMSGAITQPIFIGNIEANSTVPDYSGPNLPPIVIGTYGAAAPVVTDTGTKLITNNIAATTAAAILGVQNPVSQAASVVAVNSSGMVTGSLAEAPKNI